MVARCLILESNDPWLNLSTENWIFNNMDLSENILMFWRNSKSVIIGRTQNPWTECNLKKIEEDNVNLVRRQSGGGAVFQDLGNSIFSFLSPRKDYDKKRNFQIVINALKKFGINAEQSGRNDILVNGLKVSGSAFKENHDRAFHHGTLLIDVNLSEMPSYLTPSEKKLVSKGISSVRSRVANLVDFNPLISHESLVGSIIDEFFKVNNSEKKVEYLKEEYLFTVPEVKEFYDLMKSKEWRIGLTPEFKHQLNERFDWATIDLHLDTDGGKITRAKLFSDCLDPLLIEEMEKCLPNLDYHHESICIGLECVKEKMPHAIQQISDVQNWIKKELI